LLETTELWDDSSCWRCSRPRVAFGFINLPWLSEFEPFLANLRGEPPFIRLMERVPRAWEAFEPW